jgi:uncharacterized membrane protein YhaH (DUF805 family)
MGYLLYYVVLPLVICIACLIFTERITKGRCGQAEYAVVMLAVGAAQIYVSYYPNISWRNIYAAPLVLLLLLCVNIHFSAKRYNDAVIDEDETNRSLIYIAPVSNALLVVGYYMLFWGFYRMDEPRIPYLILLITLNSIPIAVLWFKEHDITIKQSDVPVNYQSFLRELYAGKTVYLISIDDDYIHINDFEYAVKHYHDGYVITAYRDIDREHLLTKYLKDRGIHRLGFHYPNAYFELTDEEYVTMVAEIKTFENVMVINYPFIVINDVPVFIRNNGMKYGVVLLKEDREKLSNEIRKLKRVSKERENERYVSYEGLTKKEIIGWLKKRQPSLA